MRIANFNELNKDELKAVGDMFGSELKSSMSKADQVKMLEEDGVTVELYNTMMQESEDFQEEDVQPEPQPVPDPDDEDVTVVKMTRKNATYEVRGYRFTRNNPFAVVREDDAEWLVANGGGFRPATKKELAEFYGTK